MRKYIIQFIKFSIVGIIAFVIDYGLFIVLHTFLDVFYMAASIISYVVSTIFNFVASMRHVFKGREGQSRTEQFVIFFILSLVGLGLNSLFLWLFTSPLGFHAEISKIIATFLVMIFNFFTRKYFFEEHKHIYQLPTIGHIRALKAADPESSVTGAIKAIHENEVRTVREAHSADDE